MNTYKELGWFCIGAFGTLAVFAMASCYRNGTREPSQSPFVEINVDMHHQVPANYHLYLTTTNKPLVQKWMDVSPGGKNGWTNWYYEIKIK